MNELHVQAILGPQSWEESLFVAELGTKSQVPVLTFAADNTPSPPSKWPFLVHMSRCHRSQMKAVAAIVKSNRWRRVVVIYQDHSYVAAKKIAFLADALLEANSEIEHRSVFPTFTSQSDLTNAIREELNALRNLQCRVFIVHSSTAIAAPLFAEARRMGMMAKGFVWIATNSIASMWSSADTSIISSMKGVIGVRSYYSQTSARFRDFRNRFRRRFLLEYPDEDDPEPGTFALQAYDATWVVSQAIRDLNREPSNKSQLWSNNPNKLIGQRLLESILSSNFSGLGGQIRFSESRLMEESTVEIVYMVGRDCRELGFWSPEAGFFRVTGNGDMGLSSVPSGRAIPHVRDISEAILEMRESGQMRALEDSLIASSKCPSSEEDYKNDRLGLDSFIGLFVITIGTSTIALVMLFFRQLRRSWEMFMNFHLPRIIREMCPYWQMHVNVSASRQHPNRNCGTTG